MALRLGDVVDVALGGFTMYRRERLYVQSVKTISDRLCNRVGRRNSVFADCDIRAQRRGSGDGWQNGHRWNDPGIEKVIAMTCSRDPDEGPQRLSP